MVEDSDGALAGSSDGGEPGDTASDKGGSIDDGGVEELSPSWCASIILESLLSLVLLVLVS